MERKKSIFIVFSDTGGGHRTAANAIKAAIEELQGGREPALEVVMRDVIAESNKLNLLFERMYNHLLRTHQEWMKYYISLIEWIKPNENDLAYKVTSSYTKKLISEINPAVIVSVHPW